jgi:hypothetical protein
MANQDAAVQVVTMRWGGYYRAAHVNALRRQVDAHLARPHSFVCVTDDGSGLDPDIAVTPIPEEFVSRPELQEGVYWKIALFKPGLLKPDAPTLFLDLDSFVVGPLDPLIEKLEKDADALFMMDNLSYGAIAYLFPLAPRYFWSIAGGLGVRNMRQGNSSLLVYYPSRQGEIFQDLTGDLARAPFAKLLKQFKNEQRFVSAHAHKLRLVDAVVCQEFARLFGARRLENFLLRNRRVDPRTAIVTFNGKPKAEDVIAEPEKFGARFSAQAVEWVRAVAKAYDGS